MSNRIVARSNNPLERFNRELNVAFATPLPNMAMFVTTIEDISRRYVAALEDVCGRRVRRHPVETIILSTPPDLTDVNDDDNSSSEEDLKEDQHAGSKGRISDIESDENDALEGSSEDESDGDSDGGVNSSLGSATTNDPDFSFEYEQVL